MLSGTLTLVGTSTNLLVDGVAREEGLAPFGIFEITPVGIVVAIVGTIALVVFSRFLLPDGETDPYRSEDDQLFLSEIRIPRNSGLIGKSWGDASELKRLRVVGLVHAGGGIEPSERPLSAGDRLVVRMTLAELMTLRSQKDIEIGVSMRGQIKQDAEEVVEATIAPNHPSIGHQLREIPFLNINPVRLLGIGRQGHKPGPNLTETRIRAADTVLVTGSKQAIRRALHDNPHMISVEKTEGQAFRPAKAPIAIGALVGAVSLAALGILPIMVAGLLAVGLVLFTRCLDGDEAWRSLNGDVLILVYAMLAIGEALDQAGSISMLVGSISPWLENMAPIALLFVIYVCASAFTEAISNNAVAVIMTPVAIGLGVDLGIDPRPLVIAVMFAASASFATPISYQTNTMVYAAGNYRFTDFVRIGLPMNAVVGLTTCLTLALLYY